MPEMIERRIPDEWVRRTITTPRKKRTDLDGNTHYTKPIREREGRVLHVVVNPNVLPPRIITLFFDRRLGRTHETES
ncbi:MAG: DUF4258 domain-containing protein [Planctomycetes bacterium]|nr:DUF4258 domain-containing protein [Planctomycetota bacterium]